VLFLKTDSRRNLMKLSFNFLSFFLLRQRTGEWFRSVVGVNSHSKARASALDVALIDGMK
jgi:hypothetical protein